MALDWSKEVSFSGLKRRPGKVKTAYPSKTYMNLAVVERTSANVGRNVLVALVLVVLVALFVKFGVLDFYARIDAKAAELNTQQQALSALTGRLVDYDEVLAEYQSYESASLANSGLVVDALDVLSLVDNSVRPYADVTSLTLGIDTLSLNLSNTSLDRVGSMVSVLEQQPMVEGVSVSTAASQEGGSSEVTAAVTVRLQPVVSSGEGA